MRMARAFQGTTPSTGQTASADPHVRLQDSSIRKPSSNLTIAGHYRESRISRIDFPVPFSQLGIRCCVEDSQSGEKTATCQVELTYVDSRDGKAEVAGQALPCEGKSQVAGQRHRVRRHVGIHAQGTSPGGSRKRDQGRPETVNILALAVPALLLQSLPAHAQQKVPTRMLDSFAAGFFYSSSSKGDGAVKLTRCAPVSQKSFEQFKPPFICSPSGTGFRCTNDRSLDVVFVFGKHRDCVADQKQMLDSEDGA